MVAWTAEKDQIILKGIFKFHDIKNSAPLLKYLADEIGEGCTPKAVSHRLNNIRSNGKPVGGPKSTPSKASSVTPKKPVGRPKKATPKEVSAPTTPAGSESDVPRNDGFNGSESPSLSAGRNKRTRSTPNKTYAEEESESEAEDMTTPKPKRVKKEPVEDEGFGSAYEDANEDIEVEI